MSLTNYARESEFHLFEKLSTFTLTLKSNNSYLNFILSLSLFASWNNNFILFKNIYEFYYIFQYDLSSVSKKKRIELERVEKDVLNSIIIVV